MKRIKVTEKSGASIEYLNDGEVLNRLHLMGHGLPERPELDAEGNPTGNTLPAEYTVEITDISAEHELQECISKRVAEYPTFGDFMNAFFDGDQEANLEALRQMRLAVKAKYPKPTGGQ